MTNFPDLALFQQAEAPACPGPRLPSWALPSASFPHTLPLLGSWGWLLHPGIPSSLIATLRSVVLSAALTEGLPGQAAVSAQLWELPDIGQLAALTAFSWLGILR